MERSSNRVVLKAVMSVSRPKKDLIPGLPPDTPVIFHQPKRPKNDKM